MHRSINLLAAAAVLAGAASPVLADGPQTATIMVSATDFASLQARAALDRRVQAAAEDLCGVNAAAENASWGELKRCRAQVQQDFYGKVASINWPNNVKLSAR